MHARRARGLVSVFSGRSQFSFAGDSLSLSTRFAARAVKLNTNLIDRAGRRSLPLLRARKRWRDEISVLSPRYLPPSPCPEYFYAMSFVLDPILSSGVSAKPTERTNWDLVPGQNRGSQAWLYFLNVADLVNSNTKP